MKKKYTVYLNLEDEWKRERRGKELRNEFIEQFPVYEELYKKYHGKKIYLKELDEVIDKLDKSGIPMYQNYSLTAKINFKFLNITI